MRLRLEMTSVDRVLTRARAYACMYAADRRSKWITEEQTHSRTPRDENHLIADASTLINVAYDKGRLTPSARSSQTLGVRAVTLYATRAPSDLFAANVWPFVGAHIIIVYTHTHGGGGRSRRCDDNAPGGEGGDADADDVNDGVFVCVRAERGTPLNGRHGLAVSCGRVGAEYAHRRR